MSNQYIITILNNETKEEKKGIIYAGSWYVALVRFANQISMGVVTKLVPDIKKEKP